MFWGDLYYTGETANGVLYTWCMRFEDGDGGGVGFTASPQNGVAAGGLDCGDNFGGGDYKGEMSVIVHTKLKR